MFCQTRLLLDAHAYLCFSQSDGVVPHLQVFVGLNGFIQRPLQVKRQTQCLTK